MLFQLEILMKNLCKGSLWKKNLEIKTFAKMSQFSEVLGKNVIENKVLGLRLQGLFS